MKTAATDEGERFTQGNSDVGEKMFFIMMRHRRIPSPYGDQEKKPVASVATSEGPAPARHRACRTD
jgi:hypothetical protein